MALKSVLTFLGLRANEALINAKPAFDNPETKAFREAQRKPHMRRALVAFVLVFVFAYIANVRLEGTARDVLTYVNILTLSVMCFSTMGNMLIRSGNWTMRLNPWVTCKGRVLPVQVFGYTVMYLVEATRKEWNKPSLCVVRRRWGHMLEPSKNGTMLVAGNPGQAMAFAPKSGAPALCVRRGWPLTLRRKMFERALQNEPKL